MSNGEDIGKHGEDLVHNFFEKNLSKIFSYRNPKTKSEKAQVADVLVWLNRSIFLIEVKSRNEEEVMGTG